ncbi:MAG: ABC transporter ATP-binding protein [Aggregatilineales bacterium]
MTQTAIAIHTEGLTRDFDSVRAVDHLSIAIPTGTIFGLLGENGAGKTTTVHLLLGLLQPTSGRAEILSMDTMTHGDEIRARCGVLLEHHGLYERMSATDNLAFHGRIHHMSASQIKTRTQELLTHLKLYDRRDEQVKTWSKGMKQKLALARAVFHRPAVVLLDEPTAGLDPVAAASLRDDLLRLAKDEGTTLLLNTHNLPEAEKVCDLVGVLKAGKLLATGTLEALRAGSKPHITITGDKFGASLLAQLSAHPLVEEIKHADNTLNIATHTTDPTPLLALIIEAGGHIYSVQSAQISLEDVFLDLMNQAEAVTA